MSRLIALALLTVLCGCVAAPKVPDRVEAKPLNAQCAAQCAPTCTPQTWPLWEGDAQDPRTWDQLGPLIDDLVTIGERCENARLACAQCLRRIENAGAICGFERACSEAAQ